MSNVNFNNWLLDRRHLLRGLGTALALPMLDCMATADSKGRASEAPRRSVFVYVPNGVHTPDWQVLQAGKEYELSRSLEPLRRHRNSFSVFSGLHHPGAIGQAHQCGHTWLTAAQIESTDGTLRNTVSADQLMAEQMGNETRFPSLEIAITGGTLAWSQGGVPLPAERKPALLFERLFGLDSQGKTAARRNLARRASVLDLLLDDARRFRSKIGTEDRCKLDEYLDAVRDVEVRTQRADAWLDTPKPAIDDEEREHLTRSIPDSSASEYYDTIFDLILLSLRTDMTRVITCMLGTESFTFALPELGIQQTRHELSHHNGNAEQIRRLGQADAFLTARLARFLDGLQAHSEGAESLLDRTMVLFGSGMSYGHSHGNANVPTILAGGKGLGIRHGQHVDFNLPKIGKYDLSDLNSYYPICLQPLDEQARLSNLLLTMLQRMGVETGKFGDSVGPINQIVA